MDVPLWVEALCGIGAGLFFWGLSRLDPDKKPPAPVDGE